MWFDLDINKLILQLIPTFLRSKQLLSLLFLAVSSPLRSIYDNWYNKRQQDLYKIEHTGQVYSLRKALNDRFDIQDRRIQIFDGNRIEREYLFTPVEQKPRFLDVPMYIYSQDDYAVTGVDFVVVVPEAIIAAHPFELPALINFYKQDVKRYKITSE